MTINNCNRLIVIFIAVSGCFSVLFSAWLSHAASAYTLDDKITLTTALAMQFIHTVALLALVSWQKHAASKLIVAVCLGIIIGIVFFSGSIYIKILLNIALIGKLAPVGGMLLAFSWLLIAFKR